MLNRQLSLTKQSFSQVSFARLTRRAAWVAGVFGLALIAGCSSTTTRAPVVDLSKGGSSGGVGIAQPGQTYVVKPGDTLYQIARSYNLDVGTLKSLNNINDANQLSVGQVLTLTGTATAGATTSTTPSSSAPPSSTTTKPVPLPDSAMGSTSSTASSGTAPSTTPPDTTPPVVTPPTTTTTPSTPPPASTEPPPARAEDANLISWGWPASGPITRPFTTAAKGIDIGGSLGAPVVAAADGKVMYSGNGVRGLGNLIIINHQNGFITAYAHNQTLLVKTGAAVKRGSKIAEIGQSDTTSPRLHFEIRRQGTPVDPLKYLPAR